MGFDKSSELFVLLGTRAQIEAEIAARKEALENINTAIGAIANPLAHAKLQSEGKTDGTVRFALGNRIYKAEVRKTTSYDQDALMAAANSVSWDEAKQIFKFKADVPEKAFKALPDGPLKARITAARTVKYSEPKITAED